MSERKRDVESEERWIKGRDWRARERKMRREWIDRNDVVKEKERWI